MSSLSSVGLIPSAGVGHVGLPGQTLGEKSQGISGNSSIGAGLMGLGAGPVGQLGNQVNSGFSSSFGASGSGAAGSGMASSNVGIVPYSSQMGFGSQANQGLYTAVFLYREASVIFSCCGTTNALWFCITQCKMSFFLQAHFIASFWH